MIKLLRNKWFLIIFTLSYFGFLWLVFQSLYVKEIYLQRMYKSTGTPDPVKAMELYSRMMKSGPKKNEMDSFFRLVNVLERAGKKEEAIRVLNQIIELKPEDEGTRLRLAVALHNVGKYLEAERHFIILLKEVNEK